MSGALAFNFPTAPDSMNYLYATNPPRSISGSLVVTVALATTGSPVFNYMTEPFNTCSTPAHARPFFIANRMDWSGEFSRWWANPTAYELSVARTATLTVPLTPDRWSSVNGKFGNTDGPALAGFNQALANVSGIGLTFGGGCFFGHGVNVSGGTATFSILSYSLQ